jgi:hypothetical protein
MQMSSAVRVREMVCRVMLSTCVAAVLPVLLLGWVFPEHRDIAVLAVHQLSSGQQSALQSLWSEARAGHEARLCAQAADPSQSPKPDCIDYAAWTAISGDHSCSAQDMLNTVLNAPWIIGVAQVSGRLKTQLAAAQRRDQRENAVRDSDLSLERTDPEYVTRATSNNAHFLLGRPKVDIQTEDYARLALGPNAELNALATYPWYHLRALATVGSFWCCRYLCLSMHCCPPTKKSATLCASPFFDILPTPRVCTRRPEPQLRSLPSYKKSSRSFAGV